MGSYGMCWLDSLEVGSSKNDIDPFLMCLFNSLDKQVFYEISEDLPEKLAYRWKEDYGDDEDFFMVCYITDISAVKDRLEISGYTLETCEEIFNLSKEKEIKKYSQWSQGSKTSKSWQDRIKILKNLSFDAWIKNILEINNNPIKYKTDIFKSEKTDSLIDFMLSSDWYGFPGPDTLAALRVAIEVLHEKKKLIYDITDLIHGGYFSIEDDCVDIALNYFRDEYYESGKTIVLTEGRFDSIILSRSLKILYPHLSEHFTFMDFQSTNSGGGVGYLTHIVKAFSGTGIVNKTIALFDNDTAATAAINSLSSTKIPRNIKIVQLPKYNFLENYPTLGPTGKVMMDVNSIAASIELYLGRDVLASEDNGFHPVQWTGYDQGTEKYQGEVLNKSKIQKKFLDKITECESDPSKVSSFDWEGVNHVLFALFTAFHQNDKEDMIRNIKKYYNSM